MLTNGDGSEAQPSRRGRRGRAGRGRSQCRIDRGFLSSSNCVAARNHRANSQGADGHQGRAADVVDIAAGTPSGVHADQQSHRSVEANRERRGTRAAARGRGNAAAARRIYRADRVRRRSRREIQRDVAFLTKLWSSTLWVFVELFFFRGTYGENRFGTDPLGGPRWCLPDNPLPGCIPKPAE